jgi:small nuclear ribonucleoprotein E
LAVQGFDEFMNLVIDDAVEVKMATKDSGETRKELGMVSPSPHRVRTNASPGQILLKGDNVTLIQSMSPL